MTAKERIWTLVEALPDELPEWVAVSAENVLRPYADVPMQGDQLADVRGENGEPSEKGRPEEDGQRTGLGRLAAQLDEIARNAPPEALEQFSPDFSSENLDRHLYGTGTK